VVVESNCVSESKRPPAFPQRNEALKASTAEEIAEANEALKHLRRIYEYFHETALGCGKPPDIDFALLLVKALGPLLTVSEFLDWVVQFRFKKQGRYPGKAGGPNGWGLFLRWAADARKLAEARAA
jgi:hypothetical protein